MISCIFVLRGELEKDVTARKGGTAQGDPIEGLLGNIIGSQLIVTLDSKGDVMGIEGGKELSDKILGAIDAPGTYKVTLLGSLQSSFASSNGTDGTTEFRVNGGSPVSINTAGNTSHAAVFQNITVDGTGTMNLYFNPTVPNSNINLGLLCYFILDKTN